MDQLKTNGCIVCSAILKAMIKDTDYESIATIYAELRENAVIPVCKCSAISPFNVLGHIFIKNTYIMSK